MNLVTLREAFEQRDTMNKRQARNKGVIFRGVNSQMRSLEFEQRLDD